MKRVDRLIMEELAGPWLFGVALFSALILATTYLFRITDYAVNGIPGPLLIELTLLLMPSILVKTLGMSMLLAGLLGFGRLSSDSEIVALKASGISLYRMMAPVAAMSLGVALVCFFINETIVPWATYRSLQLVDSISRKIDLKFAQPASQPIRKDGQIVAIVAAKDFDLGKGVLRGATIVNFGKNGLPSGYLYASELRFNEAEFKNGAGWSINGGADYVSADGASHLHFNDHAWPVSAIERPNFRPETLIAANTNSQQDSLNMRQMGDYIAAKRHDPNVSLSDIRNYEFAYWNKLAFPFAALLYGLLGAPLGIRNHRTGAATGFALSIAIMFSHLTLSNLMNVYARGGLIPPWLASFFPLAIGLAVAAFVVARKNL